MTKRGENTKAGIALAKARGVSWGRNGSVLGGQNKAQADAFAESLRPLLIQLMAKGRRGAALVAELNAKGVPTARGGKWHKASIYRLLQRLQPSLQSQVSAARIARRDALDAGEHVE